MADPETLARQNLALTDEKDWSTREGVFTDDCEFVTPNGTLRGPAATTAYSRPYMDAFTVTSHRVDVVVSTADAVAVEGVWTGTHTAPLATPAGDIPATGRTVELPFAMTVRVDGDRIRSTHLYYDQLGFLAQLGLVPQPANA